MVTVGLLTSQLSVLQRNELWQLLRSLPGRSPDEQMHLVEEAESAGTVGLRHGPDHQLTLAPFWSRIRASHIDVAVWRHLFTAAGHVHVGAVWHPVSTPPPRCPLRLYRFTTPGRVARTPWANRDDVIEYGRLRRWAYATAGRSLGDEPDRARLYTAVFTPDRVWASFARRSFDFPAEYAVDFEGVHVEEVP